MVADADSAARVVYDHFGGAERFPRVSAEMMEAVDRADAAKLSIDDILRPAGLDPAQLPDGPAHRPRPLPRLPHLQLPADDGADRLLPGDVDRGDPRLARTSPSASRSTTSTPTRRPSRSAAAPRCTAASSCSTSATRRSSIPTNRFLLYALYPQCRVSIHVLWGLRQQNTVFAVGRSIIDRSSHAGHRRADAGPRRRRPRGRRHLPDRERPRRAGPGRARRDDRRRRARRPPAAA